MNRRKDGTWARKNVMGYIYVIHFDSPLVYLRKGQTINVQHYIGWCADVDARMEDHKSNQGAKLIAALNKRKIGWKVAKVYAGTRFDERRMKRRGRMWKFCSCSEVKHESDCIQQQNAS
jgi:predicted GIY-YIG superfamily endonuclease